MSAHPEVDTFEEAVAVIESRFRCVPFELDARRGPAIAPTGEPYIELIGGQRQKEGGGYTVLAMAEKHAAQLLLDGVLRLGEGKSTLYWRIPPEIDDTLVMYDEASAAEDRPSPYYRPHKVFQTYCRLAFA